jgi:hypothetical protein
MAEISGYVGAVFAGAAGLYHNDIVFDASDEIQSGRDDFVTAGFTTDMKITVYGSTSNDGDYTIHTVSSDSIIVHETIAGETPTDSVLIYQSAPGTQLAGFSNWTINDTYDAFETTDFTDAGVRTYMTGPHRWTATAQRFWQSDGNSETKLGTLYLVRFFVKYAASPSAPAPVYLYEGLSLVNGLSINTDVATLITAPLTFTGVGPLRKRTLTAYP